MKPLPDVGNSKHNVSLQNIVLIDVIQLSWVWKTTLSLIEWVVEKRMFNLVFIV